ncbi:unnamed protein product [Scytosiphon promiscuus]
MCTPQPRASPNATPDPLKMQHSRRSTMRAASGNSSSGARDAKVATKVPADRASPARTARRKNTSPTAAAAAAALLALLVLSEWRYPSPTAVHAFAGLSARTASVGRPVGDRSTRGLDAACEEQRRSTFSLRLAPACSGAGTGRVRSARAAATTNNSPSADGARAASGEKSVEAAAVKPKEGARGEAKKKKKRKKKERVRVTTAGEMRRLMSEEGGMKLFELDARGDSQEMLEAREDEHPVLEVLRKRVKAGTTPGCHGDGLKVGLAIEGGGMRGCVSAGMIATILTLGLMDTFDAVYGSSAGSLVGAYAIARQEGMPRLGCSVYYDTLTGTGRHFIDTRQVFRAMGLGLFGTVATRWRGVKELVRENFGSPVLNLDYLLHDVVEQQRPLDWDSFWQKQASQPLHVIASGVSSKKAVVMTSEGGNFKTLRELTECMRASMLLPGITGPMVTPPNVKERLVDSQLYEQIPFQTALDDGCTHVLVLRSRPDGG